MTSHCWGLPLFSINLLIRSRPAASKSHFGQRFLFTGLFLSLHPDGPYFSLLAGQAFKYDLRAIFTLPSVLWFTTATTWGTFGIGAGAFALPAWLWAGKPPARFKIRALAFTCAVWALFRLVSGGLHQKIKRLFLLSHHAPPASAWARAMSLG